MTESFGARLRRQREQQHITLGQIAASTKIQASLFDGLERNDVSRWPGGIFRRSFIRAYAEAVGLNPDQICREFLERFPEPFPDGLAALAVSQGAVVLPPRPAPAPGPLPVTPPQLILEDTGEPPLVTVPPERYRAEPGYEPRLLLADGVGDTVPVAAPQVAQAPAAVPEPVEPINIRWGAAAMDAAAVLLLALVGYAVFGMFWAPLAITSLLYGAIATLALGRTPGLAVFADAPLMSRMGTITTRAPRLTRPDKRTSAVLTPAGPSPDAREAIETLDVLTLESLPQPALQIADSEVVSGARSGSYPALRPPFDLDRRRRARA